MPSIPQCIPEWGFDLCVYRRVREMALSKLCGFHFVHVIAVSDLFYTFFYCATTPMILIILHHPCCAIYYGTVACFSFPCVTYCTCHLNVFIFVSKLFPVPFIPCVYMLSVLNYTPGLIMASCQGFPNPSFFLMSEYIFSEWKFCMKYVHMWKCLNICQKMHITTMHAMHVTSTVFNLSGVNING